MIDSQLQLIDRRWKRFKNVELETLRNTPTEWLLGEDRIACVGRLKNKKYAREKKVLHSTTTPRKIYFLPRQFIYNKGEENLLCTTTNEPKEESENTPSLNGLLYNGGIVQRQQKREWQHNFHVIDVNLLQKTIDTSWHLSSIFLWLRCFY